MKVKFEHIWPGSKPLCLSGDKESCSNLHIEEAGAVNLAANVYNKIIRGTLETEKGMFEDLGKVEIIKGNLVVDTKIHSSSLDAEKDNGMDDRYGNIRMTFTPDGTLQNYTQSQDNLKEIRDLILSQYPNKLEIEENEIQIYEPVEETSHVA